MDGLDAERANNGGFGGEPTYKTIKTGFCRFCRCHSQQISHYSRRLPEVPSEWPSEFLEAERRFWQPHAKLVPFITMSESLFGATLSNLTIGSSNFANSSSALVDIPAISTAKLPPISLILSASLLPIFNSDNSGSARPFSVLVSVQRTSAGRSWYLQAAAMHNVTRPRQSALMGVSSKFVATL